MFVKRKKLEEAKLAVKNLLFEVQKLQKKPFLIGIEKRGRVNVFTFAKGREVITIETYSTMSDNTEEWKKKLLND